VVDMTGCGTEADDVQRANVALLGRMANTSLLKCSDCRGKTAVKFQHPVLQQKLATIKSESLRHQVQRALNSMVQKEDPSEGQFEVPPNPCDGVSYDDAGEAPAGGPCSVATNPNCPKLLGKFLEIQVSMQELNTTLRQQLAETEEECRVVQRNLNAEIAQQSTLLLQHQAELAFAAQTIQRVNLGASMKRNEFDQFSAEVDQLRNECSTNLMAYEAEKCQLEKIRSEIYIKIKGGTDSAMFVDCEVSEWVSSGCSVECGGGHETQTRTIKELPRGGVRCPPLLAVLPCNTHACPVDCEEEKWGAWSSCSAQCDGGIKLRTRSIITHPTRGGRPCEAITETESCNIESCDPDCELFDWSGWSECSKACNTGHMQRIRSVQTPSKNAGKCPDPNGPDRYDEATCNDQSCDTVFHTDIIETKAKGNLSVTCKAKVDVVFLIDASGSLGPDGFDASKNFAKAFIKAFEGQDAQVSVVQFWGPVTWGEYYYCTDNIEAEVTNEEMKNVCGLNLVQQLSNDTKQTLANIDSLEWPGESATTFTSGALLMAKEILKFARQDVAPDKRIVVTLTDGIPINPDQTKDAANTVKEDLTRLVFAAVGLTGPSEKYLKRLASKNKDDNFISVADTQKLNDIKFVNDLVEDVCGLDMRIGE